MIRLIALVLVGLLPVGCNAPYCDDTCLLASDGDCDDGRLGSDTGLCDPGTDCSDCGPRPTPPPGSSYRVFGEPEPPVGVPAGASADGECVPPDVGNCGRSRCSSDGASLVTSGSGTPPRCGGGVSVECGAIAMRCPSFVSAPSMRWVCVEPEGGPVGCYFDGDTSGNATHVMHCEAYGECSNGVPIERCVRMAYFIAPTPQDPGWFDANVCSVEFRFGDGSTFHQCGSCNDPCNLSDDTAEALCAHEAVADAGTGAPPVSSDCRVQIDSQVRTLRGLATTPCASSCIETFISCAERSNCSQFTSCAQTAQTCLMRCAGL